MFPFGVACVILGYAIMYYGVNNLVNGGQGPTIAQTLGLKSELSVEPTIRDKPIANQTGQPATSNQSPTQSGGVWV